jgi:hypothetical protein
LSLLDEVNDPEADLGPALSRDRTQFLFVSERGPVRIARFATCADVASPFSMPVPAPGFPNAEADPSSCRRTGMGLLTVRIGPIKAEPGRGSIVQGKTLTVR